MVRRLIFIILCILLLSVQTKAQIDIRPFVSVTDSIAAHFNIRVALSHLPYVISASETGEDSIEVIFSRSLADYPFRESDIAHIYKYVRDCLPQNLKDKKLIIKCGTYTLEELVSGFYSSKKHIATNTVKNVKWIERITPSIDIPSGLDGKHIALWSGHGYYYEKKENRWKWQRAPFFSTIEDLLTADYIYSFLTPMLENAGAYILTPKERDRNPYELTVTADSPFFFKKNNTRESQNRHNLREKQTVATAYLPYFPQTREYAVYILYEPAHKCNTVKYNILHNGGISTFTINQAIGGNIWTYIGTFEFEEGENGQGVILPDSQNEDDKTIAVRFGGGAGNIADTSMSDTLPKYAEASRYWMKRNGYPASVYSHTADSSDYIDDYKSKGPWVNYMKDSLGIPIDIALALHTDAGFSKKDSIIGTLAIYTKISDSCDRYSDGRERIISRELADIVQTQIVEDIRLCYRNDWSRRRLADRAYFESRTPDVPTVLIELLAHQNFHDMRCGLDPKFKFIASRAIYKGILKFLAYTSGSEYIVQPLPVKDFSVRLEENGNGKANAILEWSSTFDTCEPTAKPTGYLVQTKISTPDENSRNAGFDSGILIQDEYCRIPVESGKIYSFKVSAINAGGKSFPSEILSTGYIPGQKKVLIINAFNTVCAPVANPLSDTLYAGFDFMKNPGIPYMHDFSYIGEQYEFCCDSSWRSDDDPGFGASSMDYGIRKRAGNTFDYPLLHGNAIMKAGLSFCSTSASALSLDRFPLEDYAICDIITGIDTVTTSLPALLEYIDLFRLSGGNLLISGSNIGQGIKSGFYSHIFKYQTEKQHCCDNKDSLSVFTESAVTQISRRTYSFHTKPNPYTFPATVTEILVSSAPNTYPLMYYTDDNTVAAIKYDGHDYRSIAFGFPIETLTSHIQFDRLMSEVLKFLGSTHNTSPAITDSTCF